MLVGDLFAGGGGWSEGIRQALGFSPSFAINHSPDAVAMHAVNHPETSHYCQDVFRVPPAWVTMGRPVDLLVASPDCTHFSRAKGGKPRSKKIRDLAWVVVEWAKAVRPRLIMLENVEEFRTWGPLGADDRPIKDRMGETFQRWVRSLRRYGYRVEWRELCACDYGAPTSRTRLFLIARCDDEPIIWPFASHAPRTDARVKSGELQPWRTASECIDWTLPCPSIFESRQEIFEKFGLRVRRPLAEKTLKRIAEGTRRFVIETPTPFIINHTQVGTATAQGGNKALAAFLVRHFGQSVSQNLESPAPTITAGGGGKTGLIATHIMKMRGSNIGSSALDPLQTISAGGLHHAAVGTFLTKYYGQGIGQDLREPCPTITSRDRHGLVLVHGEPYQIFDIGMRMLQPRELFRAQGFPESYVIDKGVGGKILTKTAQVNAVGNSVSPYPAKALVKANVSWVEVKEAA